MHQAPDVVLLRFADEPDRYVTAFAEVGLEAICEPVLEFTYPNRDRLRSHLAADDYGGLIATSPRVARALRRAFAADRSLADWWRGQTVYAVGPKTAQSLRALDFEPRGQEAGNAVALAEVIVDDGPAGRLLFLCGNRRRDALPDALSAADVPFDELVVYETHPRGDVELPAAEDPTWVVFFSPSGIEAVEESEPGTNWERRNYRVAAIGPTTAAALEDAGFRVEAVADEPAPEAIVAAIESANEP